ncbi:MAG: hypothetical protein AB1938_25930 [Myxococcota bacterium]
MNDDSAELEYELSFTPRRTLSGRLKERPPAGATAITAFSLIYIGILWVATLALFSRVQERPSGSGVIDPGSCVVFVVLGVEMFVAGWLAARTWVALGPTVRAVLRPLMVLGPWPFVLLLGFGVLVAAGLVSGVLSGKLFHKPPISGSNWKLYELSAAEKRGVSYDAATVRCLELGDGWKVPSAAELPRFTPPFEGWRQARFWLAPTDEAPLQVWQECKGFDCTLKTGLAPKGAANQVVCFKP